MLQPKLKLHKKVMYLFLYSHIYVDKILIAESLINNNIHFDCMMFD